MHVQDGHIELILEAVEQSLKVLILNNQVNLIFLKVQYQH